MRRPRCPRRRLAPPLLSLTHTTPLSHSQQQERTNYAVLPPPPAPDAPDKLPRSLRRMLQAKAEDDAREQRKQAAKQEAADRKAGVSVARPPPAVVVQAPVALPSPSPPPAKPAAPRRQPPTTTTTEPPSSRKATRRERSKALKAKKAAARRKRGRDHSDAEEPALRPAFEETAKAPINVTLKTKHWGDASRLGAMFERQLATARARADGGNGVSAADRAAVIEAYRASKGGSVGSATRTSLK